MNINDASTTSATSHFPEFRINLTEFQEIFGVLRRMRNISLLCLLELAIDYLSGGLTAHLVEQVLRNPMVMRSSNPVQA